MTLSFASVFADAGALWRHDRDLLARVAAVFFFVPGFAIGLFVTAFEPGDAPADQWLKLALDWYATQAPWLIGVVLMQLLGVGTLFVLLLDPARPTIGEALVRALWLLPALLVTAVVVTLAILVGTVPLILPGLYIAGRTCLVSATLVAQPERGPLNALIGGIQRTQGHGWLLIALEITVQAANYVVVATVEATETALAGGGIAGPVVEAFAAAGGALANAAAMLAFVLIQAAAYRRLTGRRHGI